MADNHILEKYFSKFFFENSKNSAAGKKIFPQE